MSRTGPAEFTHHDDGTSESVWRSAGVEGLTELPAALPPGRGERLIVLAAHPDDESLGAGGLIHDCLARGAAVTVLLCTAGEASHPNSPTHTPKQLVEIRLAEFSEAMEGLSGAAGDGSLVWRFLDLPDASVADSVEVLEAILDDEFDGIRCLLVAPFRHDGHSDHDAAGAAAARVATRHGATLLEYPIWYWLWAHPATDEQWRSWNRMELTPGARAAKRAAVGAHRSQLGALSEAAGDETLLSAPFLEHFGRDVEIFRHTPGTMRGAADAEQIFDDVYRHDIDPWAYQSSWYEQRKRAVTLAALPNDHYQHALEIGCGTGVLTIELASRCRKLTGVDASGVAIDRARERLAQARQVELWRAEVPTGWPQTATDLDLVVVSEVGYYLSPVELEELFVIAGRSLRPDGHLVLCHWVHPIEGWDLDAEAVHDLAHRGLDWPTLVVHRDRDFILEVFEAPGG